ncbi:MAG: hypothetical protein PHD43_02645 [Methylococcales bacterium]|nr:hypothetical protein [Methylococcales bacterium]
MIRNHIISYLIILLLLPITSLAAIYAPILEQIKPGTITIIGESHKKIESVELFQSLALDAIKHYQCVVIALEIASDQQTILDAVMQGRASVNEITLWPPLDHPPYRRMIETFAELKQQGQCIKVVGIDSGVNNDIDRDQWMASRLAEQGRNAPILVLLGALHTLKRVNWTVRTGRPSVAEILVTRGFSVKTFPQRWIPDNCAGNEYRRSRFVNPDSPAALTILNDSMMSLINAKPHKSVTGVIDGLVVWECDKLPRDDLPHFDGL